MKIFIDVQEPQKDRLPSAAGKPVGGENSKGETESSKKHPLSQRPMPLACLLGFILTFPIEDTQEEGRPDAHQMQVYLGFFSREKILNSLLCLNFRGNLPPTPGEWKFAFDLLLLAMTLATGIELAGVRCPINMVKKFKQE